MDYEQFCKQYLTASNLSNEDAKILSCSLFEQGFKYLKGFVVSSTVEYDVKQVFFNETMHILADSDVLAPHFIGVGESAIRGVALWRKTD